MKLINFEFYSVREDGKEILHGRGGLGAMARIAFSMEVGNYYISTALPDDGSPSPVVYLKVPVKGLMRSNIMDGGLDGEGALDSMDVISDAVHYLIVEEMIKKFRDTRQCMCKADDNIREATDV